MAGMYNETYKDVKGFSILYWHRLRTLRNDSVVYTLFKRGRKTISKSGKEGIEEDKPLLLVVNKEYRLSDSWFICDLHYNPMFIGQEAVKLPLCNAQKIAITMYKYGVVR